MQINKHLHYLKIPFSVAITPEIIVERFTNVYLIYGTNGICLIDTGVAGSDETIFDYIRKSDRRVESIFLIVQTHTHPDHIGATRTIKAETGCKIALHPAEKEWLENVALQEKDRPVPGFRALVSGSAAVDRLLIDGEIFDLGCGIKLQVFHTPGHSRGSISILMLGYMALFTGDVVPVAGEMPVYEDVMTSVFSIKKLRAIDGIRYSLPSWGVPSIDHEAYKKMDEGLEYLQSIHEAVRAVSDEGLPTDNMELCRRVLERIGLPKETANPLSAQAISSHLKILDIKSIL